MLLKVLKSLFWILILEFLILPEILKSLFWILVLEFLILPKIEAK